MRFSVSYEWLYARLILAAKFALSLSETLYAWRAGANRVMLMPNARCFRAAVVCANQLVTGECAGQPLSHEKADIPGADAVRYAEGHTLTGPAEVICDQMGAAIDAVVVEGTIL